MARPESMLNCVGRGAGRRKAVGAAVTAGWHDIHSDTELDECHVSLILVLKRNKMPLAPTAQQVAAQLHPLMTTPRWRVTP